MSASPPTPPADSVWSMGSRTVAQVCRETGLSRAKVWELMDGGTFRWFALGGWGTRVIAWRCVVEYLERCEQEHRAKQEAGSAGARTAEPTEATR